MENLYTDPSIPMDDGYSTPRPSYTDARVQQLEEDVDDAAAWMAQRSLQGDPDDPLPPHLRADVLTAIRAAPRAFRARVRACAALLRKG